MPTQITPFALRPTVLAAAIALYGASALAQTAPTTATTATDTGITLSTVTVSADASAEGLPKPFAGGQVARGARIGVLGNQDMMDTPFSTTSFTNELIQNQQARSIGDVLLNDSSVRSTRGFGNFQQAYFIRGFIVYSDDVAYNGLYGLVPRQYMATEFVERVESFRGASAFLSGAGAGSVAGSGIGGVINVVPKRAPNEPLSQVTFGVQSGGEAYVAADIARRFGADQSTGIRLNLAHRKGEGAVDREKTNLGLFSLGLDWRSRNVRLSADMGYQRDNLTNIRPAVRPGADPIPAAPDASTNFAHPFTYSNSRDIFGTVRGEFDLNENITAWAAIGKRNSVEANALAGPTLLDTLGNASDIRFDNARRDRVTTGEIGVRGKFRTGSVSHTAVASAAALDVASANAYAYNGAGPNVNIYNPVFGPTPTQAAPVGSLSRPMVTERNKTHSFALSDTLGFVNDTVLLTLGARHQTIEAAGFDYTTGASTGTPYNKSHTSPVAGLVYKASKQLSVYGNYIEGLVKGDTVNSNPPGITVIFPPYVAKQKEVGIKYDAGTLGASVAFFSTSKPSAYAAVGLPPALYGEQRNQGIELSVFGEPIKGLRLLGGLTVLDAKLRNTSTPANNGNTAIGVPSHQLNVGADWSVPGVSGLSVDGRVINTGKQYASESNTQSIPSWTRTDIGTRYVMSMGSERLLTLRARVENLFDRSYWASSGGYPGFGYLVVGQPRTLVLSASIDF
ncbi:MAG: TonB-dependent siderophore receptor [Burkholderiaceae bacterium]|nr:TonB-dependent siderophore receptor [Burkholderiaceae bacterium]